MGWYSDRSLRFKLLASFGFVLVLMLGGGGFSAYSLRNTTAAYSSLLSDLIASRSNTQAINTAFITRHKVLKDAYLFNTDSQKVQSTESQVADLDAQVVAGLGQLANSTVLTPDEKQLVQQAQTAYADYQKSSTAAIAKVQEPGDPYTTQQAAAALTSGKDKPVSAALDALQTSISSREAQEQDRVQTQAERTLPITLAVVFAALALGLVIALALATTLARSVRQVAEVARHIASADLPSLASSAAALARGDLTQSANITATPIGVRSRDEVGAMAADFNRMIEGLHQTGAAFAEMIDNLRELVGHVQVSSNSLADASQQLGSAASSTGSAVQQVNQAIQTIAVGAQDTSRGAQDTTLAVAHLGRAIGAIASGAADQANQAQAASAAAVRMAADLEEVATSASGVAAASQQARTSAEHGAAAVRETEVGMTEIRAVVTQAASRVRDLGSLSDKIGAVVETIDDIAEQTNLLALNSAIEAARAGEHGRGFAVVADEVRKLAERSSRETKAISELIRQVQSGTLEAVAAMDSGAARVELGAAKAGQAARALEEIVQAVQATVHKTSGIASSSQEMALAARGVTEAMQSITAIVQANTAATEEMANQSEQVSEAIRGIATVAEEQSAGTEEVSAAAEEMSAQVEEMSAQAEEVAATAEQLKVLVSRFHLEQDATQASHVVPLKRAA